MSSEYNAKPLTSQVGGHAGVLATEDGSLVIKPALPLEHKFYLALQQNTKLEPLRPFIPKFLGTLKLEGQIDESKSPEGDISVTPIDTPQKESLVLENISHTFLKPNILDVKLGTVLYDESAPPEKVERMIQTAKDTTSFETGVRLTGFQVYNNITSEAVNTPKSYGKSIKPSDLPAGMVRFFPVGAAPSQEGEAPLADASTSGLPLHILLPILRGIRHDVAEIRDVYADLEIRMVGGSLLIVYEADWVRAAEGLKRLEEDEDEDEEEEDDDDDDEAERPGPPYVVKLIDFAHTHLLPGEGPDEGVLLGMDTILKLLDGRIAQLE
ncbi:hypothetical protein FPV67DRAFT_284732 [Lyophyllum atratum]|nr:hypothetical protein FPV67DRAFT_284732 [Lyophyllum atratum]